ncbi:DNA-directed RNA polymerase subunit beta [Babesia caballi]|uniref:DNA-directed RNA polymerase subunit beta n=1 Tax=Babesia caballi TaxID=5871 RepID=A0AAV4LSZ0_BABCB|nr:DNA-directed RNA polymerase subunit beta [Babesia caballi]
MRAAAEEDWVDLESEAKLLVLAKVLEHGAVVAEGVLQLALHEEKVGQHARHVALLHQKAAVRLQVEVVQLLRAVENLLDRLLAAQVLVQRVGAELLGREVALDGVQPRGVENVHGLGGADLDEGGAVVEDVLAEAANGGLAHAQLAARADGGDLQEPDDVHALARAEAGDELEGRLQVLGVLDAVDVDAELADDLDQRALQVLLKLLLADEVLQRVEAKLEDEVGCVGTPEVQGLGERVDVPAGHGDAEVSGGAVAHGAEAKTGHLDVELLERQGAVGVGNHVRGQAVVENHGALVRHGDQDGRDAEAGDHVGEHVDVPHDFLELGAVEALEFLQIAVLVYHHGEDALGLLFDGQGKQRLVGVRRHVQLVLEHALAVQQHPGLRVAPELLADLHAELGDQLDVDQPAQNLLLDVAPDAVGGHVGGAVGHGELVDQVAAPLLVALLGVLQEHLLLLQNRLLLAHARAVVLVDQLGAAVGHDLVPFVPLREAVAEAVGPPGGDLVGAHRVDGALDGALLLHLHYLQVELREHRVAAVGLQDAVALLPVGGGFGVGVVDLPVGEELAQGQAVEAAGGPGGVRDVDLGLPLGGGRAGDAAVVAIVLAEEAADGDVVGEHLGVVAHEGAVEPLASGVGGLAVLRAEVLHLLVLAALDDGGGVEHADDAELLPLRAHLLHLDAEVGGAGRQGLLEHRRELARVGDVAAPHLVEPALLDGLYQVHVDAALLGVGATLGGFHVERAQIRGDLVDAAVPYLILIVVVILEVRFVHFQQVVATGRCVVGGLVAVDIHVHIVVLLGRSIGNGCGGGS